MFNYLLIINPNSSSFNLRLRKDDGSYESFRIPAKGKTSRVPEIYKEEVIEKFGDKGLVIQEQAVKFVGELPEHPTRCYPGKAGTIGYRDSYSYYCIEDGEWIRHPEFPNQDEPVSCPPITGPGQQIETGFVNNVPALNQPDGSTVVFMTPSSYKPGTLVAFLNGIPYTEVDELNDQSFSIERDTYVPDSEDMITVNYQALEE